MAIAGFQIPNQSGKSRQSPTRQLQHPGDITFGEEGVTLEKVIFRFHRGCASDPEISCERCRLEVAEPFGGIRWNGTAGAKKIVLEIPVHAGAVPLDGCHDEITKLSTELPYFEFLEPFCGGHVRRRLQNSRRPENWRNSAFVRAAAQRLRLFNALDIAGSATTSERDPGTKNREPGTEP